MTRTASKKQDKKNKASKKLKLNKKTIRDLDSPGEVKGGSQGMVTRNIGCGGKTGGC